MAHRVVRRGVAIVRVILRLEHVVYQRRGSPTDCEHHMHPGTQDAGLCSHPFLYGSVTVLEVIDHKVAVIHRIIQVIVCIPYDFASAVIAELIERRHIIIVAKTLAGGIHVVSAEIECRSVRSIDVSSFLCADIPEESLVSRDHGRFGVLIILIECISRDTTFLRYIQSVRIAGDDSQRKCQSRYNKLDFHIHCIIIDLECKVNTHNHFLHCRICSEIISHRSGVARGRCLRVASRIT